MSVGAALFLMHTVVCDQHGSPCTNNYFCDSSRTKPSTDSAPIGVTGRYIRIDNVVYGCWSMQQSLPGCNKGAPPLNEGKIINLAEIQAFNKNGSLIDAQNIHMSNTYRSNAAQSCIDGDVEGNTACRTGGGDTGEDAPWIVIDYGTDVDIGYIVVANSFDDKQYKSGQPQYTPDMSERIVGARISVVGNSDGTKVRWADTFDLNRDVYTFTPCTNYFCDSSRTKPPAGSVPAIAVGRFLRIAQPSKAASVPINLLEVQTYSRDGSLIYAEHISMSPGVGSGGYARNCIDGIVEGDSSKLLCHTSGDSPSIVIDFGRDVEVGHIVVTNAKHNGGAFQDRIVGASIMIAGDSDGTKARWIDTFGSERAVYTFNPCTNYFCDSSRTREPTVVLAGASGRYIRIDDVVHQDQTINLAEVQTYDKNGGLIAAQEIDMSGEYREHAAHNCIDGDVEGNTACHTGSKKGVDSWLVIDYGRDVEIGYIVVTNIHKPIVYLHEDRIVGSRISITGDSGGKKVRWADTFDRTRDVYTFKPCSNYFCDSSRTKPSTDSVSTVVGQFLRIDDLRAHESINLAEIQVYKKDGSLIDTHDIGLSGVYSNMDAENCIDGIVVGNTVCGSVGDDPWLVIDFGRGVEIAYIVVTNSRPYSDHMTQDRIVGARISITTDSRGTKVRWTDTFDRKRDFYTFKPCANYFCDTSRTKPPANSVPSGVTGHYLRIHNLVDNESQGIYISLAEIQAYANDGRLVDPQDIGMSNVHSDHDAENCIDGVAGGDTVCHTADGDENPWLVIDYGKDVTIGYVVITNARFHDGAYQNRIVGSSISITEDYDGWKVRWADTFDSKRDVYTFKPMLMTTSTSAATTIATTRGTDASCPVGIFGGPCKDWCCGFNGGDLNDQNIRTNWANIPGDVCDACIDTASTATSSTSTATTATSSTGTTSTSTATATSRTGSSTTSTTTLLNLHDQCNPRLDLCDKLNDLVCHEDTYKCLYKSKTTMTATSPDDQNGTNCNGAFTDPEECKQFSAGACGAIKFGTVNVTKVCRVLCNHCDAAAPADQQKTSAADGSGGDANTPMLVAYIVGAIGILVAIIAAVALKCRTSNASGGLMLDVRNGTLEAYENPAYNTSHNSGNDASIEATYTDSNGAINESAYMDTSPNPDNAAPHTNDAYDADC